MEKENSLYAIYKYDFHKNPEPTVLSVENGVDGSKNLKIARGRVKTPNINNKKLVVRSCVDVQRVFVFLRKRAL